MVPSLTIGSILMITKFGLSNYILNTELAHPTMLKLYQNKKFISIYIFYFFNFFEITGQPVNCSCVKIFFRSSNLVITTVSSGYVCLSNINDEQL